MAHKFFIYLFRTISTIAFFLCCVIAGLLPLEDGLSNEYYDNTGDIGVILLGIMILSFTISPKKLEHSASQSYNQEALSA